MSLNGSRARAHIFPPCVSFSLCLSVIHADHDGRFLSSRNPSTSRYSRRTFPAGDAGIPRRICPVSSRTSKRNGTRRLPGKKLKKAESGSEKLKRKPRQRREPRPANTLRRRTIPNHPRRTIPLPDAILILQLCTNTFVIDLYHLIPWTN
jgi:hypothetical protein